MKWNRLFRTLMLADFGIFGFIWAWSLMGWTFGDSSILFFPLPANFMSIINSIWCMYMALMMVVTYYTFKKTGVKNKCG